MTQASSRSADSFQTKTELNSGGKNYFYRSLPALGKKMGIDLEKLPYSIRVLLENLLRFEDGSVVTKKDIEALARWSPKAAPDYEIQFMPARVLLQDFTGVPAVADLAAMRTAMKKLGGDPTRINPLQPVDLVVDHSVQVDHYGTKDALSENAKLEFSRNLERYEFLKWAQGSFKNFRVVPPATGIVHQVNVEYLAHVAMTRAHMGETWVFPDTVIGTDSHTPMINGLGVVGWGVGGIEAEAAMLGQPCSMLIPEVVGFKLTGELPAGTTATDLVLTVTQMLRKKGVVGKFVEFFGAGCRALSVADRATIGNMAPEYGATIGIFPVDEKTIEFLKLTNRGDAANLAADYYKAQGLFYTDASADPHFSDVLELDLKTVEPSVAGPARPQDRATLSKAPQSYRKFLTTYAKPKLSGVSDEKLAAWAESPQPGLAPELDKKIPVKDPKGHTYDLAHGSIVIAAITSCTNTSNPSVMIGAGLLAQKAAAKGLKVHPWVKTSLAPGSKVVTDYLLSAGLMPALEALGFNVVGYGCTTCIGNSGPLPDHISGAITQGELAVASVLSGNRNFEARVHPLVRANYLMSPPLVVAYALAGNIHKDLTKDPIGTGSDGKPVFLKDIWPSNQEIAEFTKKNVTGEKYKNSYSDVFKGPAEWQSIKVGTDQLYPWNEASSYIKQPPFFHDMTKTPAPKADIVNGRCLAFLGDSVTTDHISPAGSIGKSSVAGKYLQSVGVQPADFNQFGARRGNHEVMIRGTFANVRIKNKMLGTVEGPMTQHVPTGETLPIADAAERYRKEGTPTVIVAGKEYGSGSSRDWAAKGPMLQGVRAVLAESYERIHRSNLVGMGILPLQFMPGETAEKHGLTGFESYTIKGLATLNVRQQVNVEAKGKDGQVKTLTMLCRVDTPNELEYFKHGGILQFVLRQLM